MDDRIALVFSWDPRDRVWVKERGPADAAPPPADPIDNEAVQTYFLDTQTGRWQSTILGTRARQISVELKDRYRAAMVAGLAILPPATARKVVPQPDKRRKGVPLMAGLAAVVVVIGAGAFVAQAMRPKDADAAASSALPGATAATSVLPVSSDPAATTTDPAATELPASAVPTPAQTTTPRTPTPTQPPAPQRVTFSTRLANGTIVAYSGPSSVVQGTALDGVISVQLAGGSGGTEPVTLYVGQLGAAQTLTLVLDRNGNAVFSLKVTVAKGSEPISFSLGKNGEIRTLGTITVR